ncbi:hypothetical protein [Cytophaga aurantiaca]|uniref:hypothetical protein n=1 Tax=Cytophaga aurantiaca TaxID=29530 RepID=UPI00036A3C9C|nr:hypothetical protein [Cytophaga aurantiaca]
MSERELVNETEWLLRRSYSTPEKNYMNPIDGSATSRVFKLREKDKGELSVDVNSLTDFATAIGDKSKFMLFRIPNSSIIKIGLKTFHDPLKDGSNDAHAIIFGMTLQDEIMPGLLAKNSIRVLGPNL